ncbi:[Acyl-carrier-protein] S-malonyltransferase [Halobacillus karajensis]|uniref:Malonyl CoA-acyl carrier protein transacylase n=1 Tax=Halobacillus karajensis TaxID=195088 RepID=A0A024P1Q8_9BACI|nr:ACP S-malonyltransferase [Halobacillus karajensis]CDQ19774.1 Malonyl CoA-acyl carrier protein transacylase [Halobacillus karajensis]CDQ22234.1 Malonyl CoA-acyl carrier protein transacylase [Halobacillus karajensis]CDQ28075.1 Malonyl CoA-acyl carrier protein transacylase [Halobacillus karajensis]SEH72397.1 [Acyl-carrier-protein] S-malonyltransferase [Halobacillus karajensis]
MKRIACVFPGQGSQEVGMGKGMYEAYPAVKQLFDAADETLGYSLTTLMFEGAAEELTRTENAQPALLLNSMAIQEVLKEEGVVPEMTAGHSLGEYSALVASGALDPMEAVQLVHVRGKLMEEAYPTGKGTMAAVLGLSQEEIEEVLRDFDGDYAVDLANINCPGQIVISGTKDGVEKASEKLSEAGAKRVLPLNVSGPFHSRLMKPASDDFANHLAETKIRDAEIPVYANVTASPVTEAEEIEKLLVEQLYSPVKFQQILEAFVDEEVDAIVEVGQGKVLSGLVRKVKRRMKTFSVQDPESLQEFIEWYKEES